MTVIAVGHFLFFNKFHNVTMQYAGLALDELKHVRQAVGFLVCESYSFKFRYLMLFVGGGGGGAIGCDFELFLWLLISPCYD